MSVLKRLRDFFDDIRRIREALEAMRQVIAPKGFSDPRRTFWK